VAEVEDYLAHICFGADERLGVRVPDLQRLVVRGAGRAWLFRREPLRGQLPQLVGHWRQQLLGRFGIALFDGGQDAGDLATVR
jgi:hypothetical protein